MAVSLSGLKVTNATNQAIAKAKELGLTITSAYRSKSEDIRVGGTGTGYHTLGQALDVAGSKVKMDAFAKWAKSSGLFRSVLWQVPDHYDHVHVSWNVTGATNDGLINKGDSGSIVSAIQKLLGGISVDGIYGPQTEKAVKEFQSSNGLAQDGIVGEKTFNSLTGGGLFFFK